MMISVLIQKKYCRIVVVTCLVNESMSTPRTCLIYCVVVLLSRTLTFFLKYEWNSLFLSRCCNTNKFRFVSFRCDDLCPELDVGTRLLTLVSACRRHPLFSSLCVCVCVLLIDNTI